MARDKAKQPNIDGSNLANYPNKRIRDNDGSGNGTPVSESVYGDIHELMAKIMRDSKMNYNGLPDNVTNGYQLYDALMQLAGKNALIKNISQLTPTTLLIPVKLDVLKTDETIIFKSLIDSTEAMNLMQGSDAIQKALSIAGSFKTGDLVRMINTPTQIILLGLYDTQNVPNLITRLTNIENSIQPMINKLSVFQAGGGMVLWNKPAVLIPFGWHEVVDWRGRMPVGLDVSQTEFDIIGKIGGNKQVNIDTAPPLTGYSGDEVTGGGEAGKLIISSGQNEQGEFLESLRKASIAPSDTNNTNILNPYRVVLFIEYTGL